MSTMTREDEEGKIWTYEIRGSSGAPPTDHEKIEHYASSVGEVTVLEQDRISVYNCVASINAVHLFLSKSMTKVLTDIEDNHKFTLDVQTLQHGQLLDAIKDAVALWTEDDRWVRICKHKPGYVYIMWLLTESIGEEWVYRLKGSSGIPPPNKIECMFINERHVQIVEDSRLAVKDCKLAINYVLFDLHKLSETNPGIKRATKYGKFAFSVSANQNELFNMIIKDAIFPVLSKLPPIDWFACAERERGYLYLMRIDQKDAATGQKKYFCNRIFGSLRELHDSKFELVVNNFVYSEIERYPVTDCAAAFDKYWKNVGLDTAGDKDDHCYQLLDTHYRWLFQQVIEGKIKGYLVYGF